MLLLSPPPSLLLAPSTLSATPTDSPPPFFFLLMSSQGSAHCALGPYWAAALSTSALTAVQLSRRGGVVAVGVPPGGRRVHLGGGVRVVVRGELTRWEE